MDKLGAKQIRQKKLCNGTPELGIAKIAIKIVKLMHIPKTTKKQCQVLKASQLSLYWNIMRNPLLLILAKERTESAVKQNEKKWLGSVTKS